MASLIVGILAWFICPLVGGIAAIQLANGARRELSFSGEAGAELATIGRTLGWINVGVASLPLAFIAITGVLYLLQR